MLRPEHLHKEAVAMEGDSGQPQRNGPLVHDFNISKQVGGGTSRLQSHKLEQEVLI